MDSVLGVSVEVTLTTEFLGQLSSSRLRMPSFNYLGAVMASSL